jgi:hypothetical protein
MQERQDKMRESRQRSLERRGTNEFRYGYGYCSDEEELSDSEDNHNTFSPIMERQVDPPPAMTSPSTVGARTPDDLPSPPYVDTVQAWPDRETRIAGEASTKLDIPTGHVEHLDIPTPTSAKPILQSTLTSRADFTFDLYPPAGLAGDESPDADAHLDLEIPDLEPDTPIEIATPVTYSQPQTRPSVISISIKNPTPPRNSRHSSTRPSVSSLPASSSPPRSSHNTSSSIASRKSLTQHPSPSLRSLTLTASYDRRASNFSVSSGFQALEATPLDLSAPPVPSIRPEILANASRESLLDGWEDYRRASSHAKKPGMINSLRKSGLNNIMNYVKDVKTPARESMPPRPTTAASDRDVDESNTRACPVLRPHRDDYPPPLRPRTATAASTRAWGEHAVTALPTPPEPPMPSLAKSSTFELARKKSFSALRNRSSSIGKALRSASSSVVPTISTMHYPGKPGLASSPSESQSRHPSRKVSMDLASFPIPPPSPLVVARNSPRMSPHVERAGFAWQKAEAR